MEDTEQSQSMLVITGMHRSGTSLAASLLQSSGVFIGDRLMKGGTGNSQGHFEDWDFVDLHRDCLTSHATNREGWTTETNFAFSGEYLERAQNLLAARVQHPIWGWKDPRTTLFLDAWTQLIPQAKFVFVYRSPWDVVDSLFRRGDLIFKTDPEIAIKTWFSYNLAILKFCHQTEQPWLLLRIEDVIHSPQLVVSTINQQFKLNLRSPENLYDKSLFKASDVNLHRAALIQQYFPHAFNLYLQLNQQATPLKKLQPITEPHLANPLWFLQNWHQPIVQVRTLRSWSKLKRIITRKSLQF